MYGNISNINYHITGSKQQYCIVGVHAISAYWKHCQNKSISKEISLKLTELSLTYKDLVIISEFALRKKKRDYSSTIVEFLMTVTGNSNISICSCLFQSLTI